MTLPLKIWKTSFYSSDFTTYPKKEYQLFYNKARRSVILKYRPRYSSMDCDQVLFPFVSSLTHSYLTRDQVLFASKAKKGRGPPDRRLIHTSTTPLLEALTLNNAP